MDEKQEIRDALRMEKETYRENKKELKRNYKANIRLLKDDLRRVAKQQRTATKGSSLGRKFNELRLSYYESCAYKAEVLRYRMDYPEHADADAMVKNINKYLDKLEKKEELSEKDIKFLMDTHDSVRTMIRENLGLENKEDLETRILDLLPKEYSLVQNATEQMEEVFKQLTGQPKTGEPQDVEHRIEPSCSNCHRLLHDISEVPCQSQKLVATT